LWAWTKRPHPARIIIDFCFLIATGVCFLPIVLYSGALALNSLFHVGESLQISHGAAIWLLVILLGLAGILYAVIGGLRAMAVADSINGIGLVIGGHVILDFDWHSRHCGADPLALHP
jgi:solute:Na+ symporter, SSS family